MAARRRGGRDGGVPLSGRRPGGAPPTIVVEDGVRQPLFGYTDAIRQRVWVEVPFDTDSDGFSDRVAMDIIRPAATAEGLNSR